MPEACITQNDLERHLIAAQEVKIPPEPFIEVLMGSEVFMPVYERHRIAGQTRPAARPLKLRTWLTILVIRRLTHWVMAVQLPDLGQRGASLRHGCQGAGPGPDRAHEKAELIPAVGRRLVQRAGIGAAAGA
jgi:hypothetical protein